ncbi:MAG: type III-B CRISPR module-associated protein Cmr5 [Chitinophagales bacterium]
MKKKLEKLIPQAVKAVDDVLEKDGSVPKAYNGYISSMGASIIQMGLLPTLAFYSYGSDDNKRTKESRPKLLKAILQVIAPTVAAEGKVKLLDYAIAWDADVNKDLRQLQKQITLAAIAIKLAIRTFDLKDL